MVLNVFFRRWSDSRPVWYHAEAEREAAELLSEVMAGLRSEDLSSPWVSPGEDAWFSISNHRFKSTDDGSFERGAYLRVAINRQTGFGGLVWFSEVEDFGRQDIFDSIWISDNPNPPDFDPRVVADPGSPVFHDPRSAVPLDQVRAALEEFSRVGTGERPEAVGWVKGDASGRRNDRPILDDLPPAPIPENPWG